MYITLEEYKSMMGITTMTAEQEAQINLLILQTKSVLDKTIGDLTVTNRKEKIQYRDVFFSNGVIKIRTNKIGISGVISIDGVAYEWEFTVDWKLNNVVYIQPPYKATEYPYLEIEVTNWFETIPDDIKLLQAYMIKDMSDSQNGVGTIIKKKIWDKELAFNNNTSENIKKYISDVILSYSIITI